MKHTRARASIYFRVQDCDPKSDRQGGHSQFSLSCLCGNHSRCRPRRWEGRLVPRQECQKLLAANRDIPAHQCRAIITCDGQHFLNAVVALCELPNVPCCASKTLGEPIMFTGDVNRAVYAPASKPVRARIHTLVPSVSIPHVGGLRSVPAEVTGTSRQFSLRPSGARELPVEQAPSAMPLEPSREPSSDPSLVPTSRF